MDFSEKIVHEDNEIFHEHLTVRHKPVFTLAYPGCL